MKIVLNFMKKVFGMYVENFWTLYGPMINAGMPINL